MAASAAEQQLRAAAINAAATFLAPDPTKTRADLLEAADDFFVWIVSGAARCECRAENPPGQYAACCPIHDKTLR